MGVKDLHRLNPIYSYLKDLEREGRIKTNFKEDSGQRETGMMISEYGGLKTIEQYNFMTPEEYHEERKKGWREFVPDLLSYSPKTIIIEFNEESKRKRGYFNAKFTKRGHGEFNKRDVDKDIYYSIIKALYLQIWESDNWKEVLDKFLIDNKLMEK